MARIEINELPVNDELTSEEQRETVGGSAASASIVPWHLGDVSIIVGQSQDSEHLIQTRLNTYLCPSDDTF